MNEIKNCLHVVFLEKPGWSILRLTVYICKISLLNVGNRDVGNYILIILYCIHQINIYNINIC